MKSLRKIMALLIAMTMVIGMSVAVFAASDGSVTISNTTQDKEYKIYKVFDATYQGSAVSYFYDGSNETFLAALQADTSPFTITGPVDGVYNVIRKENVDDATVIQFIKGQAGNFGSAVATKTGNGASVTASGLPYGYYFITSSLGTVVTIDSALKDVSVIDKNQETTLDKKEKIANGTYYVGLDAVENPVPTASVGDPVDYIVDGTFTNYIGEDKVTKLTFTDQMSAGLTGNHDVAVKINGASITNFTVTYDPATEGTAATKTTIVIPTVDDQGNFLYPATSTYEITYSAKINDAAATRDEENNVVDLKYTDDKGKDKEIDNDETKVKDYQITLTKQDAKTKAKLKDAKFKLYDAATEGNEIAVVKVGDYYRPALTGETGVEMVTPDSGIIVIKGLANGSYFFEETEAPAGYNKLTVRTEATTITNADATINVDNNTGSTLPSTGGIGTTIFYVIGGILVAGAAIILIAKRRTNA